jgi:hypothetical protein
MKNQAVIRDIRMVAFDEHSSESLDLGTCGACHGALIYQYLRGFPSTCPNCNANLRLSADDCERGLRLTSGA